MKLNNPKIMDFQIQDDYIYYQFYRKFLCFFGFNVKNIFEINKIEKNLRVVHPNISFFYVYQLNKQLTTCFFTIQEKNLSYLKNKIDLLRNLLDNISDPKIILLRNNELTNKFFFFLKDIPIRDCKIQFFPSRLINKISDISTNIRFLTHINFLKEKNIFKDFQIFLNSIDVEGFLVINSIENNKYKMKILLLTPNEDNFSKINQYFILKNIKKVEFISLTVKDFQLLIKKKIKTGYDLDDITQIQDYCQPNNYITQLGSPLEENSNKAKIIKILEQENISYSLIEEEIFLCSRNNLFIFFSKIKNLPDFLRKFYKVAQKIIIIINDLEIKNLSNNTKILKLKKIYLLSLMNLENIIQFFEIKNESINNTKKNAIKVIL